MNIKHLQYMIEIERVGSISQAAKNLYVGQPNLSRILREVEESVGFTIFDRTHQGIRPTERGMAFLQHAHPKKTLELLAGGQAELGVIRFREEYRQYFSEIAANANLKFQVLKNYEDVILLGKNHPLAQKKAINLSDLLDYPQITHSDRYFLPNQKLGEERSRIYTVDRQGQLTLLQNLQGSYMWSAPIPKELLEEWNVVQRSCERNTNRYSEALVYNPTYIMSETEKNLLEMLRKDYPQYCKE